MKHLFIVNPAAGKGKSVELIPRIKEYFLHKSLKRTIEGNETFIDLGKANGRYFINIASAGLDAQEMHILKLSLKVKPLSQG